MMYGQSMLYANLKAFFLQGSKIFFFFKDTLIYKKKNETVMCVRAESFDKRRGYKNSKRENSIFVDDLKDS